MKKTIRSGGFFAKAEGAPTWRDRLAKMRGKAKPKPTAKLEIDDATGETMVFPEIGDISEIAKDIAVTATDGDHVFTADGKTYTVSVLEGKVTAVAEAPTEDEVIEEVSALNEETAEFIEAVAQELEVNETFRTTARGDIDTIIRELKEAREEIKTLKATMSHGGDGTQGGDDAGATRELKVGGKKIDLSKINLNSK